MIALLLLALLAAQDDVADVPSEELQAGKDANKKYFLIGAKADAKPPEKGWGLIVVLPGGDGGAAFHPFVRRIYKNAVPEGFLMAQMVSVEWMPGQFQKLVWPRDAMPAPGMKFSTEQFFDAAVEDVAKKQKIDSSRIYTLSWSSGGPAAYSIAARKKTSVAGSLVAMSVFVRDLDLTTLKGQAFYLYQSKEDVITPLAQAEQAQAKLLEAGVDVELKTYTGGHGWRGPIYKDLRAGFEWLAKKK